jgi:hypothetical protein
VELAVPEAESAQTPVRAVVFPELAAARLVAVAARAQKVVPVE